MDSTGWQHLAHKVHKSLHSQGKLEDIAFQIAGNSIENNKNDEKLHVRNILDNYYGIAGSLSNLIFSEFTNLLDDSTGLISKHTKPKSFIIKQIQEIEGA